MDVVDSPIERIRLANQERLALEYLQNEVVNNLKPMFPHLEEGFIRDSVICQMKLLIDPQDQARLTNNCIDVLLMPNTFGLEDQSIIDLTKFEETPVARIGLNNSAFWLDVTPDFDSNSIINIDKEESSGIIDLNTIPLINLNASDTPLSHNILTSPKKGQLSDLNPELVGSQIEDKNVKGNDTSLESIPWFPQILTKDGSGVNPNAVSTPVRSKPVGQNKPQISPQGTGNIYPTVTQTPSIRSPDGVNVAIRGQHHHRKTSKAPCTMSKCPCEDCKTNPASHSHHNYGQSGDGSRHRSLSTQGGLDSSPPTLSSTQAGSIGGSIPQQPTPTAMKSDTPPRNISTSPLNSDALGSSLLGLLSKTKDEVHVEKLLETTTPMKQETPFGDSDNDVLRARLERLDAALSKLSKMSRTPCKLPVSPSPGEGVPHSSGQSPVLTTSAPFTKSTAALTKPSFQKVSTLASVRVNTQPKPAQVNASTSSSSSNNISQNSDLDRIRTTDPEDFHAASRYPSSSSIKRPLPPSVKAFSHSGIQRMYKSPPSFSVPNRHATPSFQSTQSSKKGLFNIRPGVQTASGTTEKTYMYNKPSTVTTASKPVVSATQYGVSTPKTSMKSVTLQSPFTRLVGLHTQSSMPKTTPTTSSPKFRQIMPITTVGSVHVAVGAVTGSGNAVPNSTASTTKLAMGRPFANQAPPAQPQPQLTPQLGLQLPPAYSSVYNPLPIDLHRYQIASTHGPTLTNRPQTKAPFSQPQPVMQPFVTQALSAMVLLPPPDIVQHHRPAMEQPPHPTREQPPQQAFVQPPQPAMVRPAQPPMVTPPQPAMVRPPQPSMVTPPQPAMVRPPQPPMVTPPQPPMVTLPQPAVVRPPQPTMVQPSQPAMVTPPQPAIIQPSQPPTVQPPQPAMVQPPQPPMVQPPPDHVEGYPPGNHVNFDLMATEVLTLFPDVEPDYVLTKLREFQDHPSPVNLMCNHLLEDNTYPKVTPQEAPKTVTPQDKNSKSKEDFIKEYFKLTTEVPYQEVLLQLQTDFKMLSVDSLRQVMALHNYHYAPTRVCLEEILHSNEKIQQVVTHLKSSKYEDRKVKVEITSKGKNGNDRKTTIVIQLLKGRRNTSSVKIPKQALLNEIESYKEYTKNSVVEKDWMFALTMNENEYEAEGQLIECGCCYAEVPFENMIQCLDGHLFCATCLQSYAQQAVYGQGKALLMCMTDGCDSSYPRVQLEKCLSTKDLDKYDERVQEESIQLASIEGLVRCPSCDFAALLDPGDKVFKCQNTGCMKETCRHCGEEWKDHFGKRCEEIEKKNETNLRLSYEERMSKAQIRTCHRCKTGIMKDQGCNKMTCRCGAKMCYMCRKPDIDYSHFCPHARNPGHGCTACVRCSLWTETVEDDARAVKELEKELEVEKHKMNRAKDSRDRLGAADLAPDSKKQRVV